MTTSTPSRAGACLVAGAVALVAAEAVHPRGGADGTAGLVRHLAADPGRWTAWALLLMLAALLMLPGVAAWGRAVDDGPGARLGAIGSTTTCVALVALFSFAGFHGASVDIVGPAPVSQEVVDHYVAAEDSLTLGLTVVLALLGFHLGWLLLFGGLLRARRVGPAVGIVGACAAVGSFLSGALGPTAEVAAFAVLGTAIGLTGVALIRSPHAGGATGGTRSVQAPGSENGWSRVPSGSAP